MRIILCLCGKIFQMLHFRRIFRCHGTAATGCNNLVSVKGVCPEITDRPGKFSGITPLRVLCAERFRCILDHFQVKLLCDIHDGFHICHISKHMHDYDGFYGFSGSFML